VGGASTGAGGAGGVVVTACGPAGSFGGGETSLAAGSVTAAIVDELGMPVPSQPTFICGIDICSAPKATGPDGRVSIQTPLTEKRPAFKYGDGVTYAEFAVPLAAMTTDFTTGGQLLATGKLSGKPGAALSPGATAASGDVTLTLAAGANVGVNSLVYDTPDKQLFRAVGIPVANLQPVLATLTAAAGGGGFTLVYGVSPAETIVCPPLKVTVALPKKTMTPNDFGWAPGSAVQFWVTAIDTGQGYAPYAGWRKMSDGVVSSDGASVSTLPGQGFSLLTPFAVRKTP
jgi:hypothetical protein